MPAHPIPTLALAAAIPLTQALAAPSPLHTLPPLTYRILSPGPATGPHPSRKSEVVVRDTGRFENGKVFDTSVTQPGGTATFPVGRLIPGWVIALQLMRPGDRWLLTVPPEMAYGAQGAGGVIPPYATLIFDMQLISIVPQSPTASR